jgi:hypothetical protein
MTRGVAPLCSKTSISFVLFGLGIMSGGKILITKGLKVKFV